MRNFDKGTDINVHNRRQVQLKDITTIAKDVTTILIGLMISSFGTGLFYNAELGSSPMATFCDGVHTVLGISYGSANTLVNFLLLIVLFFINRKYINIGTVLCVFAIGPFVNLFTGMLSALDIAHWNIVLRMLCTILGTALMGLGLGLYVSVDRGLGALEGLVKVLCEKTRFSYSKAKILQDILLVVGGILMRAKWGVGTIIAMFLTGPVLQASIGLFSRYIEKRRCRTAAVASDNPDKTGKAESGVAKDMAAKDAQEKNAAGNDAAHSRSAD